MQKKDCIEFEQVVERGCGMDVHKATVVVTIRGKGIKSVTKSYSTFTRSLIKLKEWLKKHGITHIAMEKLYPRETFQGTTGSDQVSQEAGSAGYCR